MKEECKHEFKIKYYDILTYRPIYEKEFICVKCNKRIKMKVSRLLISIATLIIASFFGRGSSSFFKEHVIDASTLMIVMYSLLIIAGFANIIMYALNCVIWLFRKRIKYDVIEDDDTK